MESINRMNFKLSRTFEMKDLGKNKVFLALEIEHHIAEQSLWITFSKYASSVLEKFEMDSCHPENRRMKDYKCLNPKIVALLY